MVDLGAQGTKVTFQGDLSDVTFDDVSDTDAPIQVENDTVSEVAYDLNENGYAFRRRSPIRLTLSFLPGSMSDITMSNYLLTCRTSDPEKVKIKCATITYPDTIGKKIGPKGKISGAGQNVSMVLENGWLVSGQYGITVTNEGRANSRVYSFAFTEMRTV